MCRSMVDIQSATAEIRRRKKERKKETGRKYNARICYAGGHNEATHRDHPSRSLNCCVRTTPLFSLRLMDGLVLVCGRYLYVI